ncbi:hypothetical protein PFUGPA_03059 [Plasmodium falciparum Palo Alto/Uganda]|uniref:Uncharacterized protein n=7 Tax=Plasmodium falciparum TaxID=5833 RepID=A0A5K1K9E6_PLAF7|nr:conserved Plasmodium protein, unknown function [Plasmodium falciparum 3D7]ETW18692.1 hypothetical protein PFFVO_02588 [Plasmodium falciparum Vietnam Oak-Knoll (FVO)]ETW36658.1 hypothetical protein PFTANZ_02616 [Plasmodium falciparum Tanzania (2000708)]ETW42821.1 hypothetical protein PFNF135_02715 [Plasmodium falciparum NF135/5.C10]ETW55239.1 hypothetical protein PFUGPA_03059 [Plasmodium falciparum Palo Alto/Uganda]EUR72535.1 hypothetical protein PFBG_02626 [Plasmodium falciparum 7G8]EWC885
MERKEAIFYNGVEDPYVVNYIWLYDKKDKIEEKKQHKNMNINNSSTYISQKKNDTRNYFNNDQRQIYNIQNNEKREDTL